jgi:hypothetical protein
MNKISCKPLTYLCLISFKLEMLGVSKIQQFQEYALHFLNTIFLQTFIIALSHLFFIVNVMKPFFLSF